MDTNEQPQPSPDPSSPGAPATPETPTPPIPGSPEAAAGTQPASSPEAETPTPEAPAEPTPEAAAAAAARAAVYTTPESYVVNLADEDRTALGLEENDPLVAGLAKHAAESGKPQGWVDDALEAAAVLAKAGLFDGGFDPVAEAAALGENAAGRRTEQELFAKSLKDRGDIDDGMFAELMSLTPTANGIRLVEYMRKQMGTNGDIPAPTGEAPDAAAAAKTKAQEMARDPRYHSDRAFRSEADAQWRTAYPGAR